MRLSPPVRPAHWHDGVVVQRGVGREVVGLDVVHVGGAAYARHLVQLPHDHPVTLAFKHHQPYTTRTALGPGSCCSMPCTCSAIMLNLSLPSHNSQRTLIASSLPAGTAAQNAPSSCWPRSVGLCRSTWASWGRLGSACSRPGQNVASTDASDRVMALSVGPSAAARAGSTSPLTVQACCLAAARVSPTCPRRAARGASACSTLCASSVSSTWSMLIASDCSRSRGRCCRSSVRWLSSRWTAGWTMAGSPPRAGHAHLNLPQQLVAALSMLFPLDTELYSSPLLPSKKGLCRYGGTNMVNCVMPQLWTTPEERSQQCMQELGTTLTMQAQGHY
mmetsp:Transcript_20501/g.51978  ORF Transcript_20501/g.51978 Transcript_20501/m.51978 type:complete len:333 (-) Transcript_20501:321-1319(-)